MMTVNEVSKITGVSVRTLQYYDKIGLLMPSEYTKAGYRLYDDIALERLQQILLFKELEFPLKEIKEIIDASNFDKDKALNQQIELLIMKKEHLENLIDFAKNLKEKGRNKMNFKVFDKSKIEEYTKEAKKLWGETKEYKEYEEKSFGMSEDMQKNIFEDFMQIFVDFGKLLGEKPESEFVQVKVKELQAYITKNFYECSNEILKDLGKMYASGGEFTQNIDKVAGKGAAAFVARAIDIYE